MEIARIRHYFPEFSDNQFNQLGRLPELYSHWNQQVNVISRKDIDQLMERHVLHSLALLKACDFDSDQLVLDVGTGGGFPGIPLAIALPDVNFHLVDSIGKKIKVVEAVIEALGLENAKAFHERAEQMAFHYDHVVTRAVAPMAKLVGWITPIMNPEGFLLALKGGDLKDEVAPVKKWTEIIPISNYFSEEFFSSKSIVKYSQKGRKP